MEADAKWARSTQRYYQSLVLGRPTQINAFIGLERGFSVILMFNSTDDT